MRLLTLAIALMVLPAIASDQVSATIYLSVYIAPDNNFPPAAQDNRCVARLAEDPTASAADSCDLLASNYTVSRPADDTLLVEPI